LGSSRGFEHLVYSLLDGAVVRHIAGDHRDPLADTSAHRLMLNTRNPAWRSAFDEDCPIPVEAPVMIATLSFRMRKPPWMPIG
jgi:hypothetical protein